MIVAYPNPHIVRRNFTLFPFALPHFYNRFAGDPLAPPPPVGLMINTSFTPAKVDFLVNNYEGDFFGFQKDIESVSCDFHLATSGLGLLLSRLYRELTAAPISSSMGECVLVSWLLPIRLQ